MVASVTVSPFPAHPALGRKSQLLLKVWLHVLPTSSHRFTREEVACIIEEIVAPAAESLEVKTPFKAHEGKPGLLTQGLGVTFWHPFESLYDARDKARKMAKRFAYAAQHWLTPAEFSGMFADWTIEYEAGFTAHEQLIISSKPSVQPMH